MELNLRARSEPLEALFVTMRNTIYSGLQEQQAEVLYFGSVSV